MNKSVFFLLTGISGAAWTLVYILIIAKSVKDKRCGMPFFALAYNLCWEFVYSILMTGDWNVQRIINLIWLIFDVVIFITYLKYEKKHFEQEYQSGFLPWTVLTIVSAFFIMLAAKAEFTEYLGAQYSAFLQNLMMSVLFIQMVKKRNSLHAQSLVIAFAKMIGTLAPTILVFVAKGSQLLQILGLAILAFDLIYIYLLLSLSKHHIQIDHIQKGA